VNQVHSWCIGVPMPWNHEYCPWCFLHCVWFPWLQKGPYGTVSSTTSVTAPWARKNVSMVEMVHKGMFCWKMDKEVICATVRASIALMLCLVFHKELVMQILYRRKTVWVPRNFVGKNQFPVWQSKYFSSDNTHAAIFSSDTLNWRGLCLTNIYLIFTIILTLTQKIERSCESVSIEILWTPFLVVNHLADNQHLLGGREYKQTTIALYWRWGIESALAFVVFLILFHMFCRNVLCTEKERRNISPCNIIQVLKRFFVRWRYMLTRSTCMLEVIDAISTNNF
jgi:hypothetical protein